MPSDRWQMLFGSGSGRMRFGPVLVSDILKERMLL